MAGKAALTLAVLILLAGAAFAGLDEDAWAGRLAADPFLASARLARLGQAAVPLIAALLDQEDPTVRRGAAFAAGRLGTAAASLADRLRAAREDPTPAVRAAAAWALARVAPDEVSEPPVDPLEVVRRAAPAVLAGERDSPDLVEAVLRDPAIETDLATLTRFLAHENANVAVAALYRLYEWSADDPEATKVLAHLLRHSEERFRRWAAYQLARVIHGVEALIEAAADEDPDVRRVAVTWLPRTLDTRHVILKALGDADARVRIAGVQRVPGLLDTDRRKEAEILTPLLDDPDPRVVETTVGKLREIGPYAVPVLLSLLDGPDPARVRGALRALCGIRHQDESVRPLLLRHLDVMDPLERAMAAIVLIRFTGERDRSFSVLLATLESGEKSVVLEACHLMSVAPWGLTAWEEFRHPGAPVGRALSRLIREAPLEVARALEVDGHFYTDETIEDLLETQGLLRDLQNPHAWGTAPWACIRDLARRDCRDPEFLALLDRAATGDDPILRERALVARRHLGLADPPPIESILARLDDEDPTARWRAVKDLAALGPAARPAAARLEKVLEDDDRLVRVAATAALAEIRRER